MITGGYSGIGRATAVLFAMEGAEVAIAYLQEEEDDAQKTKKWVEKYGGKCHLIVTNLRYKEECKKTINKAVEAMGGINTLINNHATQMMRESILDLPEEQWELSFQTNVHPFFYLSKYALPHMTKGDTIINNASVNAYIGRPDMLDYTSTKKAIVSFTRALNDQLIGRGIRVNAIAPGPVWTSLIPSTMSESAHKEFTVPIGR